MTSAASQFESKRASDTTAKILRTALQSIAQQGLDLTTMRSVAEGAEVSTGPLYSRFESIDDLAAELYEGQLAGHLDLVVTQLNEWILQGDPSAETAVIKEFEKPSTKTRSLIEILAVARRYPFTGEVVTSHLGKLLGRHLSATPAPAATATLPLNISLGIFLLRPMLTRADVDLLPELTNFMADIAMNQSCWDETPLNPEPLTFPFPQISHEEADDFMEDITNAVFKVIAQVGFEKATANRISRASGRDFANSYHRYHSKEELMSSVTSSFIPQMVGLSLAPFLGIPRNEYLLRSGTNAVSLCSELNRPLRQLRVESLVAARHHRVLSHAVKREFVNGEKHLDQLVDQYLGEVSTDQERSARLIWLAIRANSIGISLLTSNTPRLEYLDWTCASSALHAELVKHGFATP